MRTLLFGFLTLFFSFPLVSSAQGVFSIEELFPKANKTPVWQEVLKEDKHASIFLIEVDKKVPLHLHKKHTEIVFVLRGKGDVTLGNERYKVRKGDLIWIPEGTVHGATISTRRNMQVISIQCPKWNPEDRFFINEAK